MKYELNLNSAEVTLILSALTYDIQVRHGNGGNEDIASLLNKIKSQTVDYTLTGRAN